MREFQSLAPENSGVWYRHHAQFHMVVRNLEKVALVKVLEQKDPRR
jgi:hypothetical protein